MNNTPVEHFGYSQQEFAKFKRYAWRYLLMFSFLYCALYCCRLNLSNASAVMMGELGWTKADIGILTGTLFWTYGIGQVVNGRLSEIVGTARFVVFAVLLSAVANILFSFQTSIFAMAVLWGINGFFQSMAWTPGIATLTKWWPGNSRGFATGFANAFSGFGQVAATLSVALAFAVLPGMGWRAAFIVPAAIPLVMLVIYMIFAKPTPSAVGLPEYTENTEEMARSETAMQEILRTKGKFYPYKYVLSDRLFNLWMIVAFSIGLARYGLVTWVPLYFIDQFGIKITDGLLASLALPVGMGIGTLVVPWLSDKLYLNNRLKACTHNAAIGAVAVYVFFLLDPTVMWQLVLIEVLLFVAGFCIYAINGTAWAFATDIGGRFFSGTASGCLNFCAYMGAAVQSLLYGFLLDAGGWNIVFISIAAFCGLIAILGTLSAGHKAAH